jgi:hypothetical protein
LAGPSRPSAPTMCPSLDAVGRPGSRRRRRGRASRPSSRPARRVSRPAPRSGRRRRIRRRRRNCSGPAASPASNTMPPRPSSPITSLPWTSRQARMQRVQLMHSVGSKRMAGWESSTGCGREVSASSRASDAVGRAGDGALAAAVRPPACLRAACGSRKAPAPAPRRSRPRRRGSCRPASGRPCGTCAAGRCRGAWRRRRMRLAVDRGDLAAVEAEADHPPTSCGKYFSTDSAGFGAAWPRPQIEVPCIRRASSCRRGASQFRGAHQLRRLLSCRLGRACIVRRIRGRRSPSRFAPGRAPGRPARRPRWRRSR